MKKIWILLVLSVLSLALFTACTSNADTMPSPSPMVSTSPVASPTVTVSIMPVATAAPVAPAGVNTLEDVQRVSDSIAEEVEKLSELTMAEAIVAGNIAIVGISYDAQYQGGLTDRLSEMVTERVDTIDKTITSVHVSADKAVLEQIKALRDKVAKKEITFEQLQTEVLDMGSKIAGGGGTGTTTKPDISSPQSTTGV